MSIKSLNPAPALPHAAPAPTANPNSGYWNYTFSVIWLLFFIYIASKGEIQTWINILAWNPATPPTMGQTPLNPASTG